jgi:predicted transcriptional regulator
METMPLTLECKAQLDDYAQRHGLDAATALDEALGIYLEWEKQDYLEAVEGIREGYADYMAGRTQPLNEVFEELLEEHAIPR